MPATRFTLRQLEIFAAVVRTGQVKRAAAHLNLSQAAVSQALHELADALEIDLFERRGREIAPTPTARQLLQLTGGPMAALDAVADRLRPEDETSPLSGEVRLAASSTNARYVLPRALARLHQRHPDLRLTMMSGNSAAVEEHVAALDADIGFIEGPARRDDLEVSAWRTDALQLIAPPDYPAADVSIDRLDVHPWIAREPGSGTRAVFEQNLALAGHAVPRARMIIDDSGAIVRAVAAGAGLACVSRLAARQASARKRVQFIDLPGFSLARPLWRIERDAAVHSPVIARFVRLLDAELDSRTSS